MLPRLARRRRGALQTARRRHDPRPGGVDAARRGEGVPHVGRGARGARANASNGVARRGAVGVARGVESLRPVGGVDARREARASNRRARFGAGIASGAERGVRDVVVPGRRDERRTRLVARVAGRIARRDLARSATRGFTVGRDGLGAEKRDARGFLSRSLQDESDVRDVARDGVERGAFETAHQARGVPLCAPRLSLGVRDVGGSRAIRASRQTGGGERARAVAPPRRRRRLRRVARHRGGDAAPADALARFFARYANARLASAFDGRLDGAAASRRARGRSRARTLARWHRRALARRVRRLGGGGGGVVTENAKARRRRRALDLARFHEELQPVGARRRDWRERRSVLARTPPRARCSAGAAGTRSEDGRRPPRRFGARARASGPFSSVGFVCDSPPRSTAGAPLRGVEFGGGAWRAPPRRGRRTGWSAAPSTRGWTRRSSRGSASSSPAA